MARERATEIEWLKFFYYESDFGPADSDVREFLQERFMDKTGKNLPEGWHYGSDGETIIDRE